MLVFKESITNPRVSFTVMLDLIGGGSSKKYFNRRFFIFLLDL